MMRSASIIVLFAFVEQVHANEIVAKRIADLQERQVLGRVLQARRLPSRPLYRRVEAARNHEIVANPVADIQDKLVDKLVDKMISKLFDSSLSIRQASLPSTEHRICKTPKIINRVCVPNKLISKLVNNSLCALRLQSADLDNTMLQSVENLPSTELGKEGQSIEFQEGSELTEEDLEALHPKLECPPGKREPGLLAHLETRGSAFAFWGGWTTFIVNAADTIWHHRKDPVKYGLIIGGLAAWLAHPTEVYEYECALRRFDHKMRYYWGKNGSPLDPRECPEGHSDITTMIPG